jgi:type II secretory pathway predicted ATPase ExeA
VKGYEVFFGFREPPFSLAPDTRFLFDGASHAAAREQVAYALERREPLVVVTGEIGTGKTLLCRSVVEKLERRTFLSIVHDPMLERDDLLKQMLQDFGVISTDRTRLAPTTRHELVHALQEFLLSLVPLHAHAVLVIDEAQHLQPDVMEQLRLVSNVHDAGGTLLQIVLVGQPSLDAVLSRP